MLFLFLLFASTIVSSALASKPCDGQIVMVLDTSEDYDKKRFNKQNDFVKKLFADSNFDQFERLALGRYDVNTNLTNFGDFKSQSDVAKYVDSLEENIRYYSTWLEIGLWSVYYQNYPLDKKTTVVFFVSNVDDLEIPEALPYAKLLQDQGVRLVLVGHGDSKQDAYNTDQLSRITNDPSAVFKWDDDADLPADDYQTWFKQVLACPGYEVTTEKPVTFPTTTPSSGRTTIQSVDKPCDGQIALLLDASTSWNAFTKQQFEDQKDLVKKLFVAPYFNGFKRLAIGSYLSYRVDITDFGNINNETQLERKLSYIFEGDVLSYLDQGLKSIYNKLASSWTYDKIVVVFFVSDIEEIEIDESRQWAKKLQDQGVRLILVGHGNFKDDYVNVDRLARITNDPSVVFKWDDGKRLPADDYQTWFKQVLGC
ncbi:Von Willebrand factor, type A domain-containing protein [Aphelenchoides besseyi]|nr:Von Willebrand factor, type A domain-containing protein [Aphelenchoides besseyi]